MLNVLFVLLGVHIALVLVVLVYYIPIAIRERNDFVTVTKDLAVTAINPYVYALFIIVMWIDDINDWRRK
ncbi:hypothetical protein [Paenibacillus amylolyticus]|uniref:hypothetical protein n=1 Tax=Paenibacillus amylolyticus TaxID=1451 RepID=UPI003EBC8CA6